MYLGRPMPLETRSPGTGLAEEKGRQLDRRASQNGSQQEVDDADQIERQISRDGFVEFRVDLPVRSLPAAPLLDKGLPGLQAKCPKII